LDCINDTQFKNLDSKLEEVIMKILNNQTIAKLLKYPESNALSQPDVENPYRELGTKIYTLRFKPPIDTETVIMSVFFPEYDGVPNNHFLKKGVLEIGICCHRNIWTIDDGKTRVNQIVGALDDLFNKQNLAFGLNKEFFRKTRYYDFSDQHAGYVIQYSGIDAQ